MVVLAGALVALVLPPSTGAADAPAPWLEPCGDRWCGTFEVPEDRAAADGRRIGLNVIVVPAGSPSLGSRDAIAYLSGGPGGAAASDGTAGWLPSLIDDAVVKHDLLLVDQRGTGDSNPLFCPLPTTIPSDPTSDQIRAWWASCLGSLDGDPRFYGTNDAVEDLELVRDALGYDGLHLIGGSYGAVTAQAYLLRHPEHVRTVVLDSGVALGSRGFERWARTYQDVFDRIVRRCARTPRCHSAFPDPARDLATILGRLERGPVTVAGVSVDRAVFAGLVQTITDGARNATVVPLFLRTAAASGVATAVDRLGPSLLTAIATSGRQPARVMSHAIMCAEPWAQVDLAELTRLSAGTYLGPTWVAAIAQRAAVCAATPPLHDTSGLDEPVASTVPALLTMGAEDPRISSPTMAGVRAAMPSARFAVVRTAGHGTIGYRCVRRLVDELIVTGSSAGLDIGCARQQSFPAFVLRWSDWTRLG